MPIFKIHLNFGISERLADYIRTTYGANILTIANSQNYTRFRVQAPDQQSLNAALLDLREHLVEIEEEIE